jgi:hypothetical protein
MWFYTFRISKHGGVRTSRFYLACVCLRRGINLSTIKKGERKVSESAENLPKLSFASQEYCVNLSGLETKTSVVCSPAAISVLKRNTSFEMRVKLYETMLQRIASVVSLLQKPNGYGRCRLRSINRILNAENCSSTRNKQTYLEHRKYSTALTINVVYFFVCKNCSKIHPETNSVTTHYTSSILGMSLLNWTLQDALEAVVWKWSSIPKTKLRGF